MCTRDRVSHHESGTTGGIIRRFTASSLCVFQRNLDHPKPDGRGINISGVDFWHAVEFSRNGRFLRTHPLGLSSGRFPSVFPFPTLSDLCDPISSVLSRSTLFASPFPADPTLSEDLGRIFHPARDWHRRAKQSGSRSGGAVNVLERGAPMQIEAPRSGLARARRPTDRQTSTTTGRIIGRRR